MKCRIILTVRFCDHSARSRKIKIIYYNLIGYKNGQVFLIFIRDFIKANCSSVPNYMILRFFLQTQKMSEVKGKIESVNNVHFPCSQPTKAVEFWEIPDLFAFVL